MSFQVMAGGEGLPTAFLFTPTHRGYVRVTIETFPQMDSFPPRRNFISFAKYEPSRSYEVLHCDHSFRWFQLEPLIVRETQMRPFCGPVVIAPHPSPLLPTRGRAMTSGAPGLGSAQPIQASRHFVVRCSLVN